MFNVFKCCVYAWEISLKDLKPKPAVCSGEEMSQLIKAQGINRAFLLWQRDEENIKRSVGGGQPKHYSNE